MKIDRLLGIVMQLINHKKRTAKELAQHFDVSKRTILRDIDTLTLANIPIYAERGKNGGYCLLDDYQMTKNFLNKPEAEILMALINGLDSSLPIREFTQLKDKFKGLQDTIAKNERMVILPGPLIGNNQKLKHTMATIFDAINSRQKIQITYISQKFKKTSRIIHPYKLVMMSGQWYIDAYCELRGDFRLFKLFRIQSFEPLDDIYILDDCHLNYDWSDDNYDKRPTSTVKIMLDLSLLGKISDYIDYNMCDVCKDGIKVTLDFPVDEWFYSFLMGFVPYIRILYPEEIKREFIKRLNKSIQMQN